MRLNQLKLALVAVFVIACEDPPPERAEALGSRVELAAGDVWQTADGGKERLITGAMLPDDATLTVGEGGRALVRLGTGTAIFLRGGTVVDITGGSVELSKGELWADVPDEERGLGKFEAGGVTVTAADAGIDIAVDGKAVRVYAARGFAVVSSKGGRVELGSGERAVVEGGGRPEVEPVSFFADWTGGMADRELLAGSAGRGSGRIYGIDRARPGAQPAELQIVSQEIRVAIRDGIAETVVDQRFFNPTSTPLEGWYWFTIPEGSSVNRFALEVNGALVDGEMIERKQAAAAYEEAVRKAFDPALLEWVDGRTFRARIYPVPGAGERRVVLSYTELLPLTNGVLRYVYPMGGGAETPIAEFALDVNLGEAGEGLEISTLQEARVEDGGKRVTMRRSGFTPRSDFLLELAPREAPEALRVIRHELDEDEADYLMIRYAPDVDWSKLPQVPGNVVVVLDTSAGGDDSDRQVRADAVEAILRALSDEDRFAVVATDLSPRVIHPEEGMSAADEENISRAVESLAEVSSAGATDLGEMFSAALDLLHDSFQPAVVYVGDGRPTVGETSVAAVSDRLRRALGDSDARLFTLAVGEDADHAMLERLARVGGGRAFRIDLPEQTVQEALKFVGMVKTPTITDLVIDAGGGLDQVFLSASGKLSEGSEVILTARTHNALPDHIEVTGMLGKEKLERRYETRVEKGKEHGYVPSLWARQYLTRLMGDDLEGNRGRIISLGTSYSLMTPFTSFLVLESDQAYEEQGIRRRHRHRVGAYDNATGDGVALAALEGLLGAPLLLAGCSEEDPPMEEYQQDEVPEWLKKDRSDERQGGKGKRHKAEEGQMGKRAASKTDNHYGIKGPRDNPSPHMARSRAKDMAKSAEILSYLSSEKAPAAPSGGVDPENALGQLMGNQVGENFGYGGLGLRGTGRGGGGTGEDTIGLGNLNTIGHGGGGGSGSGYGRGAGGLGTAGRRGRAPRIRSGSAEVKGSLSKEVIRRIVHRHINEVKFCYERELAKNPGVGGRVEIKFIISGTGAVQMAAVARSTLANATVENCIAQAVRRWTFPQPQGGGVVIVTYPFLLSSPEGAAATESARAREARELAAREAEEAARRAAAEAAEAARRTAMGAPAFDTGVCSDASRRPLGQRRVLWQKRLGRARQPSDYARVFFEAARRCELGRWRDRRVLLNLIEGRVRTAEGVRGLLDAFGRAPALASYLRRRILRRALDPDITMGLYFPGRVNWGAVLAGLEALKTPEARLEKLKKILDKHPDDPMGRGILVRMLFEASLDEEALAEARRLKRDGLASPLVLQILCDLQAGAELVDEARRTCSELVEFNPDDRGARLRLGDIFLRHGWYEAAYRQYASLVAFDPDDPLGLMRLAAAAAGMGKVDEALRIERKVAAGDGEPGPNDPRRWARLHSATRLARMLVEARKEGKEDKARALTRSLKRTQLFGSGAALALLVWEDYESRLALAARRGDEDHPVAERIDSPGTGLAMLDVGKELPADLDLEVELERPVGKRAVPYTLVTITWDGKQFTIEEIRKKAEPEAS